MSDYPCVSHGEAAYIIVGGVLGVTGEVWFRYPNDGIGHWASGDTTEGISRLGQLGAGWKVGKRMQPDETVGPWGSGYRGKDKLDEHRKVVDYSVVVDGSAPRRTVVDTITGLLGVINGLTANDLRIHLVIEEMVGEKGTFSFKE